MQEDDDDADNPDPGLWTKTSLIQLFYGIAVNLTSVAHGIALSFSSVMMPQLPVVEPKIITTMLEETWIVSVLPLSTLIGNIISGFMMDSYGRRIVLTLCQVPMTIGWILIGFATSASELIVGRFVLGLGCGMGMTAPRVYVTEISLPNMRGVNGSFPSVGTALGVILQATFGAIMKWSSLSLMNGVFTMFLFFLAFIFPETPYFILMKDTPEKTEQCLKKFRSVHYDVEEEMDTLLEFKAQNRLRRLRVKEQLKLLFSKSACKPFWTILIYIIISQLAGVNLVLMWTIEVFEQANSSINPNIGNVSVGTARLVAGIAASFLMLKVGRRFMALLSSLGVFVSFLILGVFIMYQKEPTVVPFILLISYIIFSAFGYYPLPMLLVFELSPLQIRGIVGGLGIAVLNVTTFGVNQCYLYGISTIGFPCVILVFSSVSLIGAFYVVFCLPETKGLTLQEIEEFYNERRPTLTSQRRIRSIQNLARGLASAQSKSLMRVKSKGFDR